MVSLYRCVNYYLVYFIYSQLLFLADWWSHAKLNIFCDQGSYTGCKTFNSLPSWSADRLHNFDGAMVVSFNFFDRIQLRYRIENFMLVSFS